MAEKSEQYGTYANIFSEAFITVPSSELVSANPLSKRRNMSHSHNNIGKNKTSALKESKRKKRELIQEHRATALENLLCVPQMGDSGFHADDISIPVSSKVSKKFVSSCNKTMGFSNGTGVVCDTSKKLLYSYTLKCDAKRQVSGIQFDSFQIEPSKSIISHKSKAVDQLKVANCELFENEYQEISLKVSDISFDRALSQNYIAESKVKKFFTGFCEIDSFQIQPVYKNNWSTKDGCKNLKRLKPLDEVSNEPSSYVDMLASIKNTKYSSEGTMSTSSMLKSNVKKECSKFQADSVKIHPQNKNIKRDSQSLKRGDPLDAASKESFKSYGSKTAAKKRKHSSESVMPTNNTFERKPPTNNTLKGDNERDSPELNIVFSHTQYKSIIDIKRDSLNSKSNPLDTVSNKSSLCDVTRAAVKTHKHSSERTTSTNTTVKGSTKSCPECDSSQIQLKSKNVTNIKKASQKTKKAGVVVSDISLVCDGTKTSVKVPKISSDKTPSTNTTIQKTYVKNGLTIQPENKSITNVKSDSQNTETKCIQEVVSNESSKCNETKKSIKVSKISSEKATLTNSALKSNVKRDLQKKIVTNNTSDSQNSQKTNVLQAVSNDSSICDGAKTTVKLPKISLEKATNVIQVVSNDSSVCDGAKTTVKVPKISSEKTTNDAVKSKVRNDLEVQPENKTVANTRSDFHKSQKANILEEVNTESFICDETKAAIKIPSPSPKNVLSSNATLKGNTNKEFSEGQQGILQTVHPPTEEKHGTKLQSLYKGEPQGTSELKVVRELACKLLQEKMNKFSSQYLIPESIPEKDVVAERLDLLYCQGHRPTEKDHSELHADNFTIRKDTKRLEQVVKDLCHTIMTCAPGIESPSQVISYLEHLTKTLFSCQHLSPRLTSHDNIRDLITHRLFCTRGNNEDLLSPHLHPQEKEDVFHHFRRELDNLRLRVKFPDKLP